mgnify:CR=1 FL=1
MDSLEKGVLIFVTVNVQVVTILTVPVTEDVVQDGKEIFAKNVNMFSSDFRCPFGKLL